MSEEKIILIILLISFFLIVLLLIYFILLVIKGLVYLFNKSYRSKVKEKELLKWEKTRLKSKLFYLIKYGLIFILLLSILPILSNFINYLLKTNPLYQFFNTSEIFWKFDFHLLTIPVSFLIGIYGGINRWDTMEEKYNEFKNRNIQ